MVQSIASTQPLRFHVAVAHQLADQLISHSTQQPMDPPHGCRPWRPCLLHHPHHHHLHHHHHHHHPLFLCPQHHPHHHHNLHTVFNCHHCVRPSFAPCPQNPEQSSVPAAVHFPTHPISEAAGTLEEQNSGEVGDGGFEEEDDDPVFVLTDEWKEFFAKSEAKRKLAKQQAKKAKNAAK